MRPFPLAPAPIHVSDEVLADLRQRLALTRWPEDAGNDDWYYGVNRAYLRELIDYWRTAYDWRKAEAAINAYERRPSRRPRAWPEHAGLRAVGLPRRDAGLGPGALGELE